MVQKSSRNNLCTRVKKLQFRRVRYWNVCLYIYIFPVSAFRQPYTSPKPPLPMILWTLKSFIVSCKRKHIATTSAFHIQFASLLFLSTCSWKRSITAYWKHDPAAKQWFTVCASTISIPTTFFQTNAIWFFDSHVQNTNAHVPVCSTPSFSIGRIGCTCHWKDFMGSNKKAICEKSFWSHSLASIQLTWKVNRSSDFSVASLSPHPSPWQQESILPTCTPHASASVGSHDISLTKRRVSCSAGRRLGEMLQLVCVNSVWALPHLAPPRIIPAFVLKSLTSPKIHQNAHFPWIFPD